MPRPRITPSFVVAVLALVVASSGVGFAAGQITSSDIRNGTITGIDVRDRGLGGADVRARSIPRNRLNQACASGEAKVFGGCVRLKAFPRSSYLAAVDDCNRRNGRLPTLAELAWIAANDEYTWADGNPSQYEFSGDYTTAGSMTPVARDRAGNPIYNANAQLFWHHCVVSY